MALSPDLRSRCALPSTPSSFSSSFLERFFRFLFTLSSLIYLLPIFPDFLCYQIYRVREGSVAEGLRMWPNSGNQKGSLRPASLRRQVQIDNGNQLPTARAQNASGSGRRRRGVPLSSVAAAAIAPPQQTGFPNPASAAVPITSSVGLPISIDQGVRLFESGETSTSRQPQMVSTQYGFSCSQQILSQIRTHNIEISAMLNNYSNTIRGGIEEAQKRYWTSHLAMMEQMALRRILEKHVEVENANRRNSELEERISKLTNDNQTLSNLVRHNETLISNLKAALRNAFNQRIAAAAPPPAIESCDENVLIPLLVSDEQSCCKVEDATTENKENVPRRMICKVCLQNEISLFILHCRHLCLCEECESKVDVCPICNSLKAGTVQILMP